MVRPRQGQTDTNQPVSVKQTLLTRHINKLKIGRNHINISFLYIENLLQVTVTSLQTVSWRTWRGRASRPPPPLLSRDPPSWSASASPGPPPVTPLMRLRPGCPAPLTPSNWSLIAGPPPRLGRRLLSSSSPFRSPPGRVSRRVSRGGSRALSEWDSGVSLHL